MIQQDVTTPNVWQALDAWAPQLKFWQRYILSLATRGGTLTSDQIDRTFQLFLEECKLSEPEDGDDKALDVSGRPAEAITKQLYLQRVEHLCGVNALPEESTLTFGTGLTIIYGCNGAGKTGFARLIATACFSRNKSDIISNIYADTEPKPISAMFHLSVDGTPQEPVVFGPDTEYAELRRISFFDTNGALRRVSETAAFEFRPSGFDVFPEMVRVYGEIGQRLDAKILARTRDTKFSDFFVDNETPVSKAVAAISGSTDLEVLRALSGYGPTETARLLTIDAQLVALKSGSSKETLAALGQARGDIDALVAKLKVLGEAFTGDKEIFRNELGKKAKDTAEDATKLGIDQFRRAFFNAVGSPEWQTFSKAAHALANKEGASYPTAEDRCLLCEQPLNEHSRQHISALLSFVEGDAQRRAASASKAVEGEIAALRVLEIDLFSSESRVREHVHRLDPSVEDAVVRALLTVQVLRERAIEALQSRVSIDSIPALDGVVQILVELRDRLDNDVTLLQKDDASAAITILELERQTLRHREVFTKLLPTIENHVANAAWCAKAQRAKQALNPRHVTDKEKDLFAAIIGKSYRERLAQECENLNCAVPVELQTTGQKGKTVRSLQMKGGYKPACILSEGEQRAVALADFLTEVGLNPANAGIVLDDPVTSQDHERKTAIAARLVVESASRQVIVFTHDLVFLNLLLKYADDRDVGYEAHWMERDHEGRPGRITLGDVPATSKAYDTTERAMEFFAKAQLLSGKPRHDAISGGMGALRRTIEETIAKRLFKGVVPRWSDRVIVTGLRKIAWDDGLADDLVTIYEELSKYIEGHSHTDEASGAPTELKELEKMIQNVDTLIKRSKPDRKVKAAVSSASDRGPT